jgi:DNA-3-methyladenine glycosylase II
VRYTDGADLDEADAHLAAVDAVMAALIQQFGPVDDDLDVATGDLYGALILAITSQQLSTRSARAIYGRLTTRFGGRTPTPEELLADDPDTLRTTAGFSHAKVRSLRSLAEHIVSGELDLDRLREVDDDEATRALVAVKGIGDWTASMFLIFTLHRPDVLARGDLGIRQAAKRAYGLQTLPDPDALTALGEGWRPYRTRACLYLWRSLQDIPTPTALPLPVAVAEAQAVGDTHAVADAHTLADGAKRHQR